MPKRKSTIKSLGSALADLFLRPVETLKEFWHKGDVVLLGLCVLASLMGVVLIYSATRYKESVYISFLRQDFVKQAVFILLGVVLYVWITFVDIEYLMERWWWVFLALGLFVILLIIPFGREIGGNKSWVYFPGIPIGFQPGEIAKLAYIVVLAWLMNRERQKGKGVGKISALIKYLLLTVLFAGLLAVLSGDFGMVLVYLGLLVIMAWEGGVSKWWFLGGGAAVLGTVVPLWVFVLPNTRFWDDYRIKRIRVVFDHDLDPQDRGWQQGQSIRAIGSGQLTGQGYLKGAITQSKIPGDLPARYTDEIFAVCGEEFGLLGCCAVLLVLLAIICRCVWVSRRAKSHLSAYISMGIAGMLMVQTIINVGMCLYVLPVVGLTLPFFSYGGTSTLTLFIAMGVVSGIKMRPLPSWLRDRSQL